jgi:hypothetical protein
MGVSVGAVASALAMGLNCGGKPADELPVKLGTSDPETDPIPEGDESDPARPQIVSLHAPLTAALGQIVTLTATSDFEPPDDVTDAALVLPTEAAWFRIPVGGVPAAEGVGGRWAYRVQVAIANQEALGNTELDLDLALMNEAGAGGYESLSIQITDEVVQCPGDSACGARTCGADPICGEPCGVCAEGMACTPDGFCEQIAGDGDGTTGDGDGDGTTGDGDGDGDGTSGDGDGTSGDGDGDGASGDGDGDGSTGDGDGDGTADPSVAIGIAAGNSIACAWNGLGQVKCWGPPPATPVHGTEGVALTSTTGVSTHPYLNFGFGADPIVRVEISPSGDSLGPDSACALTSVGDLYCWGENSYGALGYANNIIIGDNEAPGVAGTVQVGGTVVDYCVGGNKSCALLETGDLRCWGWYGNGHLGYSDPSNHIGDNEHPETAAPVDFGATATAVRCNMSTTCVLTTNGTVRCWGDNNYGLLGWGNASQLAGTYGLTPAEAYAQEGVSDIDIPGTVTQLEMGRVHACALVDTGDVYCWGNGSAGRLGYGNTFDVGDGETPAFVGPVPLDFAVVELDLGDESTCVRGAAGQVRCWGAAQAAASGTGAAVLIGDDEPVLDVGPVDFGGAATQIATGFRGTFALMADGSIRAWGFSRYWELGYGALASTTNEYIGDDEVPADWYSAYSSAPGFSLE